MNQTNRIKIGLVQHRDQGSREQNLAYIAEQVRQAANQGVQLCLLQELHNSAYFCQIQDPDLFSLAEPIPGPTTAYLSDLAKELNMVIVGSVFEAAAASVYFNTAIVLDSNGELAGRYRKMHIPQDPGYEEKFYFTPGDGQFEPIKTSVGNLGVLVCWDQWFPEAARLMTLAGADLLLYPTAIGWDPVDDHPEQQRQRDAWQTVQRGHAVANGIHVLACNRVGTEHSPEATDRKQIFWGTSFVAGPQGEILAQAPEHDDHLLMQTIDLDHANRVRRIWPFFRDRRIDAYTNLNQRTKQE